MKTTVKMAKVMALSTKIRGLYAVTPDMADTEQLCAKVRLSLKGGATLIQYRNKQADSILRIKQAQALLAICREFNVPLIINDHIKLCLAIDADGVHIGGDDGDVAATRARLGSDKILGVSCYNQLALAQQAEANGADYVAFGACFNSGTKPNAPKAELSLFTEASHHIKVPVVGIGGVTLDNAPSLIAAGADSIAVINSLFAGDDVKEQTERFSRLFV